MLLKNKKTGEIKEFALFDWKELQGGATLESLTKEWEDYKEPKEYWYIYTDKPQRADCGDILEEDFKAIGNYFDTREEAEKAVEKLKAWKRLKDKGFEITGFEHIGANGWVKGKINFLIPKDNLDEADLDLLFGGEE